MGGGYRAGGVLRGGDGGGRDGDGDESGGTRLGGAGRAGPRVTRGVPPRGDRVARATARRGGPPGDRPFGDPASGLGRPRGADADSAQGRRAPAHRPAARRQRGAAVPPGAHEAGRSVRVGKRRPRRAVIRPSCPRGGAATYIGPHLWGLPPRDAKSCSWRTKRRCGAPPTAPSPLATTSPRPPPPPRPPP